MKKDKLAIRGGNRTINYKFKKFNTIGKEEENEVLSVIRSGVLSGFSANWNDDFYGGEKVKLFETICAKKFGVKYSVAVNSWTSGLIAAVGAAGIEPGDEVITTPWTMCATATAILHWNAIPVFADIDEDTFNIDPTSIEKNVTPQTRAIIAVDIFGHPCDMMAIKKIAKKYNLIIIGDTAQASGTNYYNMSTGSEADIGGISLNRHKHIQSGEGGVCFTNNHEFYEKLMLIRNHAEAVVDKKEQKDITNMIGYNFRMGEIEAAIGIQQINKLDDIVKSRQKIARLLDENLSTISQIRLPIIKEGCTHSFYIYPIILDLSKINKTRKEILNALEAEGVQGLAGGYVNIHRLPMFQKKIAYGKNNFPWSADFVKREVNYNKGICPIAEELHDKSFIAYNNCHYDLSEKDIKLIGNAFVKVFSNIDQI